MQIIDLHVHTFFSDGTLTPEEVVSLARKRDVTAIAITDHDTIDGLAAAIKEGERVGVEIIPGIELSATLSLPAKINSEIHLLGYFIDWSNLEFKEMLIQFQQSRRDRALKIIQNLNQLGLDIEPDKVLNISPTSSLGRLHIARLMVQENKIASIKEAFDRYLDFGRPAYVPKFRLTPEKAIAWILQLGGVAVLAHPTYQMIENGTIPYLIQFGLGGVEVWHTRLNQTKTTKLVQLIDKYNLIGTGGSDCHGPLINQPPLLGSLPIPYQIIDQLRLRMSTNHRPVVD